MIFFLKPHVALMKEIGFVHWRAWRLVPFLLPLTGNSNGGGGAREQPYHRGVWVLRRQTLGVRGEEKITTQSS